jgi:hypothetical protein
MSIEEKKWRNRDNTKYSFHVVFHINLLENTPCVTKGRWGGGGGVEEELNYFSRNGCCSKITKHFKRNALEPIAGWMFTRNTVKHLNTQRTNATLKTQKNQIQIILELRLRSQRTCSRSAGRFFILLS